MVVIQDVTYYIIVQIETDIFSRRSIDYLFLRTFLLPPLGLFIIIPKFILSGNRWLQAVSPTCVTPIYVMESRR